MMEKLEKVMKAWVEALLNHALMMYRDEILRPLRKDLRYFWAEAEGDPRGMRLWKRMVHIWCVKISTVPRAMPRKRWVRKDEILEEFSTLVRIHR